MTAGLTTFVDIDAPPERVWQVLPDMPADVEWKQAAVAPADRNARSTALKQRVGRSPA